MNATNIPGLQTFIHAMIGLAVAIGLLVIFLTMYTTVIERPRPVGVFKSLGADRSFIIRALLSESTALCILGIAAGVGLSYLVRAAFLAGFPTLSILITPEWILRASGIAVTGAILGVAYPGELVAGRGPSGCGKFFPLYVDGGVGQEAARHVLGGGNDLTAISDAARPE